MDHLIAILEIIAIAGRGLTAAEVQKANELPRPTCYRLLPRVSKRRSSTTRSAPALNTQKDGSRPNSQGFMGVSSVAVPVLIGHIRASFGVGAVGPVHRLEATYRKRLVKN
ncbi:helix-turn-helix domain-containing protein [Pseudorhodobacter antarcticus]|uniref:helix-turn-helix domain-containing protein n=1 Tax=Pseudorhodobacter antarcticus TaxID=1077947 RepID=UPI001FD2DCC6|nr:helix-turn-helix domain-containing protein [Pseudorhodobacter antarcticus]